MHSFAAAFNILKVVRGLLIQEVLQHARYAMHGVNLP